MTALVVYVAVHWVADSIIGVLLGMLIGTWVAILTHKR